LNIVILSADNKSIARERGIPIPKGLIKINGISILERLIGSIIRSDIQHNKICVITGNQGDWFTKRNIQDINDLHDNVIINEFNITYGSSYSAWLGLEDEEYSKGVLFLDGDLLINPKILNSLTLSRNEAICRPLYSFSEAGGYLETEGQKITSCYEKMPNDISNIDLYCGICYIHSSNVKLFKDILLNNKKKPFINSLNKFVQSTPTYRSEYNSNPAPNDIVESNALKGGSYASLNKRTIVRKEATSRGVKKLISEIDWLLKINKTKNQPFPSIINHMKTNEHTWYDMPFFDFPNMRDLLMEQSLNTDVTSIIEHVLDYLIENIYCHVVSDTPKWWVKSNFIDRINLRLIDSIKMNPNLEKLIYAKEVTIDGTGYKNIPEILEILQKRPSFYEVFAGDKLRMVHGDLHFQNILVDSACIHTDFPFVLVDPRGDKMGSSIFYDLGKLVHSANGLYDFLHTDQFALKYNYIGSDVEASLIINNDRALKRYSELHTKLIDIIGSYKLINKDPNWLLKVYLSEFAHFASVMPFHLDSKSERGISMYLMAVKLGNEFLTRFNIEDNWMVGSDYINVNSIHDYEEAVKTFSSTPDDLFDYYGEKFYDESPS
jgi:choline kinase